MDIVPYNVCPPEIITHIISFLDPESAMILYVIDPSVRKLFPVISDVKVALKNRDIANLRRLSETTFPIDKETYVLACASGVMKFIELLEEREPKVLKVYNTDMHKCMSWTDAGLIAAIKNKRLNVIRRLMDRKTSFNHFTSFEITRTGLRSNNLEIMTLIDPCYQEILFSNPAALYHIVMEAAYITDNMSLVNVAEKLDIIAYHHSPEYYRARYTGKYDVFNNHVMLGLYGCKVSNILETQYINPAQYDIFTQIFSTALGIGGNMKTIRKFMEYNIIDISMMLGLYENDDENSIEILKEVFKHWAIHDTLEHNLRRIIREHRIPSLKFIKLLLETYLQLPNHDPNIKVIFFSALHHCIDEKKDVLIFLINEDRIMMSSDTKRKMDVYIQESEDEEMKALLGKIPIRRQKENGCIYPRVRG